MPDPKQWSAADVQSDELVGQAWIDANVKPGKPYNAARHRGAQVKERTKRGLQKLRGR